MDYIFLPLGQVIFKNILDVMNIILKRLWILLVCVCVCAQLLSRVLLLETPWTVAHQLLLSMGFLRQEYWSGLPFPSPGDLPDPGMESVSPATPTLAGRFFTTESPG